MIRRMPFLRTAIAAALILFGAASQAHAGLDFADVATVGAGTAAARFDTTALTGLTTGNFNAMTGGGAILATDTVRIYDVAGGAIETASLSFTYNHGASNAFHVDYDTSNGYDLYLELAAVTGAVTLTTIQFSGPNIGTPAEFYNVSQVLSGAAANGRFHISIPSTGLPLGSGISLNNRVAQTVTLNFAWAGGIGNSITINAIANPEPSTLALFGLGALGIAAGVRRRRKRRAAATS